MTIAIIALLVIIIAMLIFLAIGLGKIRQDIQIQRTIVLRTMGILDPDWAERWEANRRKANEQHH